jgi:hypothetical protein
MMAASTAWGRKYSRGVSSITVTAISRAVTIEARPVWAPVVKFTSDRLKLPVTG